MSKFRTEKYHQVFEKKRKLLRLLLALIDVDKCFVILLANLHLLVLPQKFKLK